MGTVAALASVMVLAAAIPAQAASTILDPATASLHMVRKSDIAEVIGLTAPLSRIVDRTQSRRPPLCNQANQRLVQGPAADSAVSVDVYQQDSSGVVQSVFAFGSASAAAAAFGSLVARARQCEQINALPILGRGVAQLLTFGEAPVAFDGVPGSWTRELHSRSRGADRVTYDSYTLNLLVGAYIQQLSLIFFDAGRTSDVQRSATDTLALTLAKRWES